MYYTEASNETPLVSLNLEKGVFLIDGDCVSENPDDFFNNISNCIKNYSNNPCENTTLTINLGGINISSSKFPLVFGLNNLNLVIPLILPSFK